MATIEQLLHRRTDLSTFLVHFTRTFDGEDARERLLRILVERRLLRGQPMGVAVGALNPGYPAILETQRVVCFTETPLEHAWMVSGEIEGRQVQLQPYGVVFTKTWGRVVGINPVWYVDITPNGREWLTGAVNDLVADAVAHGRHDDPVFRLTPFIETMGRLSEAEQRRPKEFSWEREWRSAASDLSFRLDRLVCALVPEDDHDAFRDLLTQAGGSAEELRRSSSA